MVVVFVHCIGVILFASGIDASSPTLTSVNELEMDGGYRAQRHTKGLRAEV